MKSKIYIIFALAFIACVGVGCSDKAPQLNQSTATDFDTAKEAHDLYIKANGNFSALSPQDQADFNKISGGAAAGQKNWKSISDHDSTKRGGAAPGAQPTTSGRP
jgi:hypothetical protein